MDAERQRARTVPGTPPRPGKRAGEGGHDLRGAWRVRCQDHQGGIGKGRSDRIVGRHRGPALGHRALSLPGCVLGRSHVFASLVGGQVADGGRSGCPAGGDGLLEGVERVGWRGRHG